MIPFSPKQIADLHTVLAHTLQHHLALAVGVDVDRDGSVGLSDKEAMNVAAQQVAGVLEWLREAVLLFEPRSCGACPFSWMGRPRVSSPSPFSMQELGRISDQAQCWAAAHLMGMVTLPLTAEELFDPTHPPPERCPLRPGRSTSAVAIVSLSPRVM